VKSSRNKNLALLLIHKQAASQTTKVLSPLLAFHHLEVSLSAIVVHLQTREEVPCHFWLGEAKNKSVKFSYKIQHGVIHIDVSGAQGFV
jgi:hypothetical protein